MLTPEKQLQFWTQTGPLLNARGLDSNLWKVDRLRKIRGLVLSVLGPSRLVLQMACLLEIGQNVGHRLRSVRSSTEGD